MDLMKAAAHLLLFIATLVLFFLGLGTGLQHSPLLGTVLWLLAGGLLLLNILWLTGNLKRRKKDTGAKE